MTLFELYKNIQNTLSERPDSADWPIILQSDPEGNDFHKAYWAGSEFGYASRENRVYAEEDLDTYKDEEGMFQPCFLIQP